MDISNSRVQHPVGQGFFHSAEISVGGGTQVTYVCDCGAMSKYAKARNTQIDAYVSGIGAGATLDLLFISHVHANHVNASHAYSRRR